MGSLTSGSLTVLQVQSSLLTPNPLPADTPLLMQPRVLLVFWAESAHC